MEFVLELLFDFLKMVLRSFFERNEQRGKLKQASGKQEVQRLRPTREGDLMTNWQPNDIEVLDRADELEVSTFRTDGSARPYVPIWVVRVGDDAYVRSYRGAAGAWFRHARNDGIGRIRVAGMERAVAFTPPDDPAVEAAVDQAYRTKYARHDSRYVTAMLADDARATTLRLQPRAAAGG